MPLLHYLAQCKIFIRMGGLNGHHEYLIKCLIPVNAETFHNVLTFI